MTLIEESRIFLIFHRNFLNFYHPFLCGGESQKALVFSTFYFQKNAVCYITKCCSLKLQERCELHRVSVLDACCLPAFHPQWLFPAAAADQARQQRLRATYVSKDVTNHCYQDLQSAKSVSDPGQVSATTPHASGEGLSTGMPPGMKRQAPPSIPSKTCPHVLLLPNFVAPAAACDAAGAYSMDMTAVRHATASALRCAQPKC